MKMGSHIIGLAAAAMLSASAAYAGAATMTLPVAPPQTVQPVASDCNALARQMAQQLGGKARASIQNRGGGQRICIVVVVIEGKAGERGQQIRREFPLD